MQTFTCHLSSLSPYSQSYYFSTAKPLKMKPDEFDELYWREHAHVVKSGPQAGHMVIPAQHFKNALAEVAKYLSVRIAGKGQSTYSKNFRAGVLVPSDLILPVKVAQKTGLPDPDEVAAGLDVPCEAVMCAADGKPGSAKKVKRHFPIVNQWAGDVTFLVVDETIDEATFVTHLRHAGQMIGIGRWRPINNGRYGRFLLDSYTLS
jgi:hypothetical protein